MKEVTRGDTSPNVMNQGGIGIVAGVAAIVFNLLVSSLGWLGILFGVGLIVGAGVLIYRHVFRLASFLLMVLGIVMILKNVFILGVFIDLVVYTAAVILILAGAWGLYRHYSR